MSISSATSPGDHLIAAGESNEHGPTPSDVARGRRSRPGRAPLPRRRCQIAAAGRPAPLRQTPSHIEKPVRAAAILGADSRKATDLLVGISSLTDLWLASDQRLAAIGPLRALLTSPRDGIGETTASKLLARKRPRLVPVTDRIIVSAVGVRGQAWQALRYSLQDGSFRRAVEVLRPRGAGGASVLRLLGVALWMLRSQSRAARKARDAAGLTPGQ